LKASHKTLLVAGTVHPVKKKENVYLEAKRKIDG